jgi:dienelactone hydrolase
VLRYDKRGVGESTGVYTNVGRDDSERVMPLLAADMAAGVRFLQTLPEIDRQRIGLFGNSQAGWIIPQAAAAIDVRFFIIFAGPTVSVGQEMYYSDFSENSDRPFDELSKILAGFKGPHGFDPVPTLRRLNTPGLWLLGGMDRSIPTRECVEILERLKADGRPFTLRLYPTGTHSLVDAHTGARLDIWPDIDRFLQSLPG